MFLYNNYEISYEELLLKSDRGTMNVNRLRLPCIEIYKTINNLNPEFLRDLFNLIETSRFIPKKYMLNLNIPVHNQVTLIHHKTQKVREYISKAKLGLLKRPECTALG